MAYSTFQCISVASMSKQYFISKSVWRTRTYSSLSKEHYSLKLYISLSFNKVTQMWPKAGRTAPSRTRAETLLMEMMKPPRGSEHITSITIYFDLLHALASNTRTRRLGSCVYLRGGCRLSHWRCSGSPLCTRTCSRRWCRAPRPWTAAYCTSCTWSSSGGTLCCGPCARGRSERCPASSPRTWSRTVCKEQTETAVSYRDRTDTVTL